MACAVVLIAAGLLRLLYLTEKPLHHDEGVNGFFLTALFRHGFYHYDPANYHGPTLYYFGLLTTTLNSLVYGKYGLSTFAIRLVPALFGIGTVWLILCLRRHRHLGTFGSIAAALLAAVSPGFVFFSRYFIHEIPFIFFTLALIVAVIRFRETSKPKYLMWASASAALLFATKETSVITIVVLLLAHVCTSLYMGLRMKFASEPVDGRPPKADAPPASREEIAGRDPRKIKNQWIAAAAIFAAVYVLFYSSFFTNFPQGVFDSVRTFGYWGKTGLTQYQSPWYTHLNWLAEEELPSLVLGGLGIVAALYQGRSRFAVFSAFWAMGITAAYSLVPYKTPWLAINILLPLAIMAGYLLGQWFEFGARKHWWLVQGSAILGLLAVAALSSYQAIDLSFFRYDDDHIPYVYAHTRRDFLGMIDAIESLASHNPAGKNIGISVMSPEHWPLPWYLRDYQGAAYWGRVVPSSEPIIIALDSQSPEIEKSMGVLYRRFYSYELRPGNVLVLYLRRDQRP
ncbi:MAG TPA: flippase activity-associated protein Agl23 [Candidatus Solibacter sp.]|nr:flippase activity-associated protein Agl23 [Candidatus Solibacter sp.]